MTYDFWVSQTGHEGAEVFKNITEHGLTSPQAAKCGELLTLMIQKCWPQPKTDNTLSSMVILKHLLTWGLWPCFLQRFGKWYHCTVAYRHYCVVGLCIASYESGITHFSKFSAPTIAFLAF